MRLVLDTNAAVSGLLWHGNPGKLIDAAQAGSLILCASAPLLAELHGVLGRELRLQREVKTLESRRDEAWRAFDQASRELEGDKEKLLDDIERRLTADIRREPLFTLRWRLV